MSVTHTTMELLLSASIIAAFIAGVAALFAPCCITVLLPSYFASIFRERYKVFLMTFIFFLGILTVFLPIGLGAAALGKFFSHYHNTIFGIGGVMLFFMAWMLLTGRHVAMPWSVHPALKKHNAFSVYMLGIFSGIATTCCAPVLAGVLTLAAIPGSIFWGVIYTLSYVFGMVAPLFVMSIFIDKVSFIKQLREKLGGSLSYTLLGRDVRITIAEFVSGATFLLMGSIITYLALTNRLFSHSTLQTDINISLTQLLEKVSAIVTAVPEYLWAALLIAVVAAISAIAIKQLRNTQHEEPKQ